jgi:hypothetical protein
LAVGAVAVPDKSGRLWETFFHEKGEKVQVDLAQIDRAAPEDS